MNVRSILKTCSDCRWSATRAQNGWDELVCRRHPPVAIAQSVGNGSWSLWPHVLDDDWCGEWESKDDLRQAVSDARDDVEKRLTLAEDAVRSLRRELPAPEKMHGYADQFPGEDYPVKEVE